MAVRDRCRSSATTPTCATARRRSSPSTSAAASSSTAPSSTRRAAASRATPAGCSSAACAFRSARPSTARARRRSCTCRPRPTACRPRARRCAPSSTGSGATATCACTRALHLLCSLIPFPVTGGSIGADESRLDFDISDAGAVDKDDLTERLNALVAADHPVTTRWITDEELADNPGLVRTMSVKPPTRHRPRAARRDRRRTARSTCSRAAARMCARPARSARVAVTKIEKKGRQNRRIRLAFAERT